MEDWALKSSWGWGLEIWKKYSVATFGCTLGVGKKKQYYNTSSTIAYLGSEQTIHSRNFLIGDSFTKLDNTKVNHVAITWLDYSS